ncbi:carboxylesterase/lipase family protein [Neorhizobium sp. DAR64861/K0K2]|uniref:carboxylesterase/lipase family protein n=1 Tax=unclassified Neorhizobium TaxID=2629175 RepID=UPI003D2A85A5
MFGSGKKSFVRIFGLAAMASAFALSAHQGFAASAIGTVNVEGGRVSGVETDIPSVEVFKGIPFAAPTSGENRFRPPQPVAKWEGVKKADTWGDQALQDIHGNPTGAFWGDEFYFDPEFLPKASENGLNLNVWTPAKSKGQKLPVYVWIHGGANHHGYASEMEFYASKLAQKGIIVVAIQYRVGAPGFLALPELSAESPHKVSGNYAILDQIKALEWVRDNIAGFGGDPKNVTIGGQSAGARNSTMLLRSPLAKGLFHRAVIESGQTGLFSSPMQKLAEREEANRKGLEQVFGKATSLADLRAIPTDDFIAKTAPDGKTQLYEALHKATNLPAQHALDGYVFTDQSVDLLKPGALDGIDIMLGGTSDEYTSLTGGPDKTFTDTELAEAMGKIGYDDAWKDVYRPSDPRDAYRKSLRARADYNLQGYILSAEIAKSRNKNFNIYTFYFNHAPPGRNSEFYGSFHSSDLWYFMNSMRDKPGQRSWTSADYRMGDTMSSYLANFVKSGNPNGGNLPEWPQGGKGTFMRFHDGYAFPVKQTPYPERDKLNRDTIIRVQKLDGMK